MEELTREVGERERVVSEIREGGCVDRQQAEGTFYCSFYVTDRFTSFST